MEVSGNCVSLIKHFESLKLHAYKDIVGIPTIGWGHTRGVQMGDYINAQVADIYLANDLREFSGQVEKALTADEIEVTQSQFDALVCFAFNLGTRTLVHGSRNAAITHFGQLWTALRAHDLKTAQHKFGLYVNNPPVRGLVIRRGAEAVLFSGQDWSNIKPIVEKVQRKTLSLDEFKLIAGI